MLLCKHELTFTVLEQTGAVLNGHEHRFASIAHPNSLPRAKQALPVSSIGWELPPSCSRHVVSFAWLGQLNPLSRLSCMGHCGGESIQSLPWFPSISTLVPLVTLQGKSVNIVVFPAHSSA